MNDTDSQRAGRRASRTSAKRPMRAFMFIDSSDHGTNAKPDKAVRSFVMHQARRQKPWSTRQKRSESPPSAGARRRSKAKSYSVLAETSSLVASASGSWRQTSASPTTEDADHFHHGHYLSGLASPVDSKASSISSTSQASLASPTTGYGNGSVCNRPDCTGALCGMTHLTHTSLARRDGFALGVLDPFASLPVRADAKTSSMIHHCKPTES